MEKKMSKRSLVVSLIGRPNVGKSSLFNRIMRKGQQAITHDLPGVTRDRHYGIANLKDRGDLPEQDIILVDTGGFYPEPSREELKEKDNINAFFNIMADHGKLAIEESDLVLLVVDVREGLNPFDKMIVDFIRKEKKDFFLIINKFDSTKQEGDEVVFYELGLNDDQMFRVSAEHGRGLDAMREEVHRFAYEFSEKMIDDGHYLQKGVKPRHDVVGNLAIVGAPNAGKSTLLNALVGAKRALVSDIAGTTVDPIEAYINLNFAHYVDEVKPQKNVFRKLDERLAGEYEEFKAMYEETEAGLVEIVKDEEKEKVEVEAEVETETESEELKEGEEKTEESQEPINTWRSLKVVDTAGIRKSRKVEGYLESQSVFSALRSITESDVVIFVIDALKGVTHQDRRLLDIALEKGKSVILCLNKIDLMKETIEDGRKKREWLLDIRHDIPWLRFCELIPLSAKNQTFLYKLKKSIVKTLLIRHRKIPTGSLNRHITYLVNRNPVFLKGSRGKVFKVKYTSMLKATPPTFILFCNKSQNIPANYKRYLQNGIREEFNLVNTPVHLIFRSGADLEKRLKKTTK